MISVLRCDECQLAKNKRIVFSVNLNKRSTCPFDLVYFDVWYAPMVSIYWHHFFVVLMMQLG